MKQLIALIVSTILVYALSSVLAGNWNLFEWHWAMRLIAVLWLVSTWSYVMKNNSDNPK
jgi:hypothetical protein